MGYCGCRRTKTRKSPGRLALGIVLMLNTALSLIAFAFAFAFALMMAEYEPLSITRS